MASTTGLCATETASTGTRSPPATRTRCSQVDESGIQICGTCALPFAWPNPVSVAPRCPAMAAATSAGSCSATVTDTQVPPRGVPDQFPAAVRTAGAISGAAAIDRLSRVPHEGELSSRYPPQPASAASSTTETRPATSPRDGRGLRWRPVTRQVSAG